MKKLLLVILVIFFSAGTVFAQTEILTNKSVTDMIGLGFSEDVIVAKIKTTDSDFDTNVDSLKELKEKGVPDAVIVAMMSATKSNIPSDSGDIVEPERKLGIFISESGELRKVLPVVFSGTKTNTLGSALSYGLASSSIRTVLNNSESVNVVHHARPEFIFFFATLNDQSYINNGSNQWFFSASSPNEFVLVKLDKKRKTRELKTGSVNLYSGTNIGIDENSVIPFEIVNMDDYTFKVVPRDPLIPGEYCFFYKGSISQGGSAFDFSVQAKEIPTKYKAGNKVWVIYKGKPKSYNVDKSELKRDGVYYSLYHHFPGKVLVMREDKCFSSKKEAINALSEEEFNNIE